LHEKLVSKLVLPRYERMAKKLEHAAIIVEKYFEILPWFDSSNIGEVEVFILVSINNVGHLLFFTVVYQPLKVTASKMMIQLSRITRRSNPAFWMSNKKSNLNLYIVMNSNW
jgi:hypothetical protein